MHEDLPEAIPGEAMLTDAKVTALGLGVSRFTLYRLAAARKIPTYRCGKAIRFDMEEIREWMRQQATKENHNGTE
jgi:excisionase family DNA binding protein